jgi:hypothetical protein
MHRALTAVLAATCVVLSAQASHADDTPAPVPVFPGPQASPLMSPEHAARIREEIRLHEQRAHELEPIIARDRQARRDVETDWIVLERHARELHARANEFRAYANEGLATRAQQDMNTFANELDASATHDEESAHLQHEVAERLERALQAISAGRDWHMQMAQRLRDWLARNGY